MSGLLEQLRAEKTASIAELADEERRVWSEWERSTHAPLTAAERLFLAREVRRGNIWLVDALRGLRACCVRDGADRPWHLDYGPAHEAVRGALMFSAFPYQFVQRHPEAAIRRLLLGTGLTEEDL
jgi:hypothetical protein